MEPIRIWSWELESSNSCLQVVQPHLTKMSDRKAELERKKAKLAQIRAEKEARRKEREAAETQSAAQVNFVIISISCVSCSCGDRGSLICLSVCPNSWLSRVDYSSPCSPGHVSRKTHVFSNCAKKY